MAAARSNLDMAVDLERGDLAVSRAHWMLGAHLLTSDAIADASAEFQSAREYAELAGSAVEVELADAFLALSRLAQGLGEAKEELHACLQRLSEMDGGDMFVAQITTAQSVIGL